jgi:ELWxxDGT repeat protein
MIKDMFKINSISDVSGLAYILAETSSGGQELWRTTAGGSIFRIKTIRTSAASPSLHNPTATDGVRFYFIANDGIHGNEIWKSTGTEASTFMISDLNQNDYVGYDGFEFDIESMALVNRSLVFSAADQNNDWLLYTYGTMSGIFNSYSVGYQPMNLTAHNNKVYFVSDRELYTTDGTSAPFMLAGLGIYPREVDYAVINDLLYISVSPYSTHIWQTDGTACGTVEIYTGGGSFPIAPSGDNMILGGSEPYIYRNVTEIVSPCYTPAVASSAANAEEPVMTPYPNPFTNEFTLKVNGNDEEIAEIGVYTFQGLPVDKFENVKCNTAYYNVGGTWPRGMYIVKVYKGGKLTTHTVVKK